MNRRTFSTQTLAAATAIATGALSACRTRPATAVAAAQHENAMVHLIDELADGDAAQRALILPATPRRIGMLVYPGMYPLDLLGPKTVFNDLLNTRVHLIAPTLSPVPAGNGVSITPDVTYDSCPTGLDVIFVPGGGDGTVRLMQHTPTLQFLRTQAESARWVTSVCTGSLVLGAAGLLDGYRATTHWVTHDVLRLLGATPVHERVVEDRNRITSAGVTAGLDMAFTLTARLAGENYARAEMLNIEYDPDPPFRAGSPKRAGRKITNALSGMYAGIVSSATAVAKARARG
ncbi:DJ-1/PfpI family protein [Gemmatimonas sp.]|jgi:cyclohexyl-isocyanide hydratase|uniref:DJ-1/PfpI family protein n=1 Tax=Gemmatimonas sp. TaxID=1962908 RepID=UPI0022BA9C4B|nr:DJ-1/PfpI family protein [Gemmatimonas sp.]MCZ8203001.1 DJ-1/PfpI family protein [Gemmatimonas sp.]